MSLVAPLSASRALSPDSASVINNFEKESVYMRRNRTQIRQKMLIANTKCWNIVKRQATEFCCNTGLHGYKYISHTQRSKTERIVWAIVVFVSLGCAIFLMKMAWNYYAIHPTLTVIESTHRGIWHYPFPAITVCNINRISYNLTKKFVENLKTPPNVSKEYLIQEIRLMNELIIPGLFGYDIQKNLTHLQDIIDDNQLSILNVMKLVTQNCSTLLKICKWKGTNDQCDKYFKQILARDGLCCSFNYYTFPDTIPDNVERSAACGFETGMTIIVDSEPNDYHATIVGAYGLKVLIHNSFDYPDFNTELQLVQLNSQHFVSINPEEMYSKPEVKDLAISTRRCIFSDEANKVLYKNVKERNLTFTAYSYHNCLAECRASITRAKCGCIPYFFPQNSTRICNLKDIECLKKYKSFLDTAWPEMNYTQKNLPKTTDDIKKAPCGCIPDCSLYYYPIESSLGLLDKTLYYSDGSFSKDSRNATSLLNHTIIHVFFNDLVGFQYRRAVNYSWRNIFASFGGLLGLFAGFSLMSIFELLYFFVIRVMTDACMHSIKHSII